MSLPVSRPKLLNLYLTNFGVCFANQCTQNQIRDIRAVFFCLTVLLGFFLKLVFELERVTSNSFCFFPRVSCSQPTKFGKLIFNRFWGVFCQSVLPESNLSHICQICLLDSALCFFIKIYLRVTKSNFKIIFAPSLGSLPVCQKHLLNLYLTNFGAYFPNECTQNQT